MSDLYDQIVRQRGGLQNLLQRIPGFRGYNDRADRRTADTMLRDYIAGELAKRISRFASIEKTLVDNGGLMHMSKSRDAKTKLQTYHDRVKAAAPGYSGFFAAIKVNAEELERLYAFDEAQIRYVDRFDEALNQFEQAVNSKEGIEATIAALQALATEANEAFSLRENVLTNLDKSLS
ncbi:MAG: hypothetical protein K8I30_23545 [Anaerolineae bacterium]|nr:hypothetical protein [Anaerolineae bacterium]